jgi:hypothetical protein
MELSVVAFGGLDKRTCKDDAQWFPIVQSSGDVSTQFKVDGFRFGKYVNQGNFLGVFDTGLSVLMFPRSIVDILVRTLDAWFDNELMLYLAVIFLRKVGKNSWISRTVTARVRKTTGCSLLMVGNIICPHFTIFLM